MKAVIAIDSFKGSLSTIQAGNAARDGILRVYPDADVTVLPLADGGEGTVSALIREQDEKLVTLSVKGPLGRSVTASYGITNEVSGGKKTAVIEMAAASGITLIAPEERDPLRTTTYGVGELIRDAIDKGCRNFIVGIGGSATNDCGIGMLSALGFRFLDENGAPVSFGAHGVGAVRSIDIAAALPALKECTFHVACDVTNPLCGDRGCSAVYGPQKGATPETVKEMDGYLSAFARLTASVIGHDESETPGVGAAGGLGFAFLAYLGATLEPGVGLVIRETALADAICGADFVITGEGRLDDQTCMGKAPTGVADLAKQHGISVLAFSGCVTDGARLCNEHGIDAFFPVLRTVTTLADAMNPENASKNLTDTAEQVFRLIKALKG